MSLLLTDGRLFLTKQKIVVLVVLEDMGYA